MGIRPNHYSNYLHLCFKLEIHIHVHSSSTDNFTVLCIQVNKIITSLPDSKAPIRLSKTSGGIDRIIKRKHCTFIRLKIVSGLLIKDAGLQPHNGGWVVIHKPTSPQLHLSAKIQLDSYSCNIRGLYLVSNIFELFHFD